MDDGGIADGKLTLRCTTTGRGCTASEKQRQKHFSAYIWRLSETIIVCPRQRFTIDDNFPYKGAKDHLMLMTGEAWRQLLYRLSEKQREAQAPRHGPGEVHQHHKTYPLVN
jgi:hypothetical protein